MNVVEFESVYRTTVHAYNSGIVLPEMARRLCEFDEWVAHQCCSIRDKRGQIIPLLLNRTQRIVLGAMMHQALLEQPIRLDILKGRTRGVTTEIKAIDYHFGNSYPNQTSATLAHIPKSTGEIWQILHTIYETYPGFASQPLNETIRYKTGSRGYCHTAGGHSIGAGGTLTHLHCSEVALWFINKQETHYAATESVDDNPLTLVVNESTARGRELFWNHWHNACNPGQNYIGLFVPWFIDLDLLPYTGDRFAFDDYERWLIRHAADKYGIELGYDELGWRRLKIAELPGGVATFKQEHPATPAEAVQGFKDRIIPDLRECVIPHLPFDYGATQPDERLGGYDHGYKDPTAMLDFVYRDQVVYVIGVYRATGAFPEDHIKAAVEGHTYYCDPSDAEPRAKLQQLSNERGLGCRFLKAPRKRSQLQKHYVNAEWLEVRKMAEDGRLKIVAGCEEQLIVEADSLMWDERTSTPMMGHSDECGHFDTVCALRYGIMGVLHGGSPPAVLIEIPSDRIKMDRKREFGT